ncbi:hypothetical protein NOI66_29610, partial [Neorhizobium galegae]|uniref:hypothetical protein n=1 Tax=Neorhizobium galegae TaxID=399 RepID=UPI002104268F
RPHPHKGAGLEGHLAPEVFRTPIDCQAIFLLPLAVRRIRRRFAMSAVYVSQAVVIDITL